MSPMLTGYLLGLSSFFYGIAWVLVLRQNQLEASTQGSAHTGVGKLYLTLSAGLGFQAVALSSLILKPNGYDVGLIPSLVFAIWIVNLGLLVSWRARPLQHLGLILFPLATVTHLIALFGRTQYSVGPIETGVLIHILISISAFSILLVAAAQAVLLWVQNHNLKTHTRVHFFSRCPPLQTMELLLFEIIQLGAGVLSIAIISGFVFLDDMLDQQVAHKTLFSMTAWIIFCALLIARSRFNIRGTKAVKGTLLGYLLLLIGFLGSKWVLEVLLAS